jgi:hypothetical protein
MIKVLTLLSCLLLSLGCDKLGLSTNKSNALGNRPDLDCIIANDFYAVHFSTYIQPEKGGENTNTKAAFVPYCQKIPNKGRMYFTADLIDRDIRSTPIGIRLIEVDKLGNRDSKEIKEIRTVLEIPAKLYPKGAVEAQADIDKLGNYQLFLLIGDAIQEDDKFKIDLEVGVAPDNYNFEENVTLVVGVILLLSVIILIVYLKRKSRKSVNG